MNEYAVICFEGFMEAMNKFKCRRAVKIAAETQVQIVIAAAAMNCKIGCHGNLLSFHKRGVIGSNGRRKTDEIAGM